MPPLLLRLIWPSWLLVLPFAAGVALADPVASPWLVRVWQVENASDSNIHGVAQAPDGFLWVAATDHLARFDGLKFEKFGLGDSGQTAPRIRCFLQSRDGSLWLALEDGPVISMREGATRVFPVNPPAGIPQTLVEDRTGAIWTSYNRGAVCRIQQGGIARMTEGLPAGSGAILATDREGNLWFAKHGEIGRFRNGRFETLLHLENVTTRLAASADGGMWIFSGVHLLKYHEGEAPVFCGSVEKMNREIRATVLLEAADGSLWIGTQTGGLLHYDGAGFEAIPASHRTINGLLQDREGDIWAATGAGLDRIRPRAISVEGAAAGLPSEAVQSLCEDTEGVIWAGTKGASLVRRAPPGWQAVPLPTDPAFEPVNRVAADPTGGIWVGTRRYKLHRLKNGKWTNWDQADGLSSHTITALCVSRAGEAWVAGEQPTALCCVASEKVRPLALPAAATAGRIWSMAEDPSGDIWAVGDNGTILRVSDGRLTDESLKTAGPPSLHCLLVTGDGAVWIGSDGMGLGRLKDGHMAFITAAQGLASDHISQIAADDNGWFWFGGDTGIFRARQSELEAVAEGRLARLKAVVRYGEQEGVPALHPTADDWGSALRSRDGRLWLPLGEALAIIDPKKPQDSFEPPIVIINRIQMDDRTVASYHGLLPEEDYDLRRPPAHLRLPPGHRRLEFDFTGLSFRAPEGIRFLFQLEGFDNQWIDAGTQRSASYSRLPPGDYRFRVRACSDGLWDEADATVAFTVTPFMWQRWWFQLAALAGFTFVVAAIARYVSHHRLRRKLQVLQQQTALEQERSRIARDLHDDLGSRLTRMVLLNELVLQGRVAPEESRGHAQGISTAVRDIIQSLDETVWAINPRNDALPQLINYIGQFAVDFLKIAGVRCRLDLPDYPPARTVSAEVRHNLFLAVKEALNNAVRHGRPTEVWLRVSLTDTLLTLTIEDNGRGFSRPSGDPEADGLRNMRRRMEDIGGQFQIESTPGSGARVILTFPWQQRP